MLWVLLSLSVLCVFVVVSVGFSCAVSGSSCVLLAFFVVVFACCFVCVFVSLFFIVFVLFGVLCFVVVYCVIISQGYGKDGS